jgi:hypothetical protein
MYGGYLPQDADHIIWGRIVYVCDTGKVTHCGMTFVDGYHIPVRRSIRKVVHVLYVMMDSED